MAAEEKRFYGNMLLSLSSGGKQPAGVLATTFCENNRDLKERLPAILNYAKNTARTAALTLVLAFLPQARRAVGHFERNRRRGAGAGARGYEKGRFRAAEGQSAGLNSGDLYIDGKLLEDVPETFINLSPQGSGAAVPDGRKGERAGSLLERDQTILFFKLLPQHNIYLYGYPTRSIQLRAYFGHRETQQIYAFPYFYASDESLPPR
jgi:hypothetical protein